ncbi:hypothetical protein [Streptomyces resistomycificus]|uniref:hypothetical protein n=1 Tax=Streptomyces resistomycificus TaxID=67356 RepID=UPI000B18A915
MDSTVVRAHQHAGTPRRNPFPRQAVLLPAPACALAGAVVGGLALTDRDGNSAWPPGAP